MRPITAEEVFRFVAQSTGVKFTTLSDGGTFKVKNEMGGVSFYPENEQGRQIGQGRPNSRELIEHYVALFNQEQSFVTTPFLKAKLRSASYFVAMVKAMLEYLPPEKSPAPYSAAIPPVPPPDIESQLIAFVLRSSQAGQAERNANLIAFYYGFRGNTLPTLEDTVASEGLTRERARQIIGKNFRRRVKPSDIPGVFGALELLRSSMPLNADDFIDSLRREKLIAGDCSPAGLLRLIHEVTRDDSVGIFDQNLRPINSAQTIEHADEQFFVLVDEVSAAQAVLREARTLPGQLGIAKFGYLEEKLGFESGSQKQVVRRIIETSSQFWTKRDGADLWYLCEERENTLINNLFKAHRVTDSCPVEELAAALHRALKSRSLDYPVAAPEVIGDYLRQCRYVEVRDGIAYFRKETCSPVELSPTQEMVRLALAEFGEQGASLPALNAKLTALAEESGDKQFNKAIMNSPVVWVSESPRGHTYRLLTFVAKAHQVTDDERRLEKYRELLRTVSEPGTDAPAKIKRRREQFYLAEFVFADANDETCAICQSRYPVTALVAAHKKPRYRCTHSERIDPRIVMPLCLLGCDFLYEENLVFVENGVVCANPKASKLLGLGERVAVLSGMKIAARWTQGPDYFRKLE